MSWNGKLYPAQQNLRNRGENTSMSEPPNVSGLLNISSTKLNLKQVGALAETSQRSCLSACTRQDNPVSVSSYSFPNSMFLNSYEVLKLIRKLDMSCNLKTKIFGPRRALLDEQYPQLCPFIDQIPRKSLSDPLSPYHFFDSLNMSKDDLGKFKEQLLTYASKNLVRINAYFDSPYLSKFQTDEVCIVDMLFQLYDDLCYFFSHTRWCLWQRSLQTLEGLLVSAWDSLLSVLWKFSSSSSHSSSGW